MQQLTPEHRAYIQDQFRVPIATPRRGISWIACLTSDSLLPTDIELSILRNFIEYEISLDPTHQADLLALPLAHNPGRNAILFRKGDGWTDNHDGWYFGRSSWGSSSLAPINTPRAYSLLEVIDLEESLWSRHNQPSPEWRTWQSLHPDLFALIPPAREPFVVPEYWPPIARLASVRFDSPLGSA